MSSYVDQLYPEALAAYYNTIEYEYGGVGVGEWDAQKAADAVEGAGYSLQEHLIEYGRRPPIVDELFAQDGFGEVYVEALARYFSSVSYELGSVQASQWDVPAVEAAIADTGSTVREHFLLYARRPDIIEKVNEVGAESNLTTQTGLVTDGYVEGATVFADQDGDGVQDPGEPTTTTDAEGNFDFGEDVTGQIIASGGTDVSTGLDVEGTFSAPEGSEMISPLTTLVSQIQQQSGQSASEAEAKVKTALGLSEDVDLQTFDPLQVLADSGSSSEAQQTALQVQAAVTQVVNTVSQAGSAAAGATGQEQGDGNNQAMSAIAEALTQAGEGEPVDLSDGDTVKNIVKSSLAKASEATGKEVDEQTAEDIASNTAKVTQDANAGVKDILDQGGDPDEAVTNMAKNQKVSQGEAAQSIKSASESGDFTDTEDKFTGDNFQNEVDNADVTDPEEPDSGDDSGGGTPDADPFAVNVDENTNEVSFTNADNDSFTIVSVDNDKIVAKDGTGNVEATWNDNADQYDLKVSSGQTMTVTQEKAAKVKKLAGDGAVTVDGAMTVSEFDTVVVDLEGGYTYSIADEVANIFTGDPENRSFQANVQTAIEGAQSVEVTDAMTVEEYGLIDGSSFDVGNLTYSLEDSWANISAAEAAVIDDADTYSISDLDTATLDNLSLAEAGLLKSASNYNDEAYTVEDTWGEISTADPATLVSEADSYSISNAPSEDFTSPALSVEEATLLTGADNYATSNYFAFKLTGTGSEVEGNIGNAVFNDAESVEVTSETLNLTAAQADGKTITGDGSVNVTSLEDLAGANLSTMSVTTLNGEVDVTDNVTLNGNLNGANLTVTGSNDNDSDTLDVTNAGTLGSIFDFGGYDFTTTMLDSQHDTLETVNQAGSATIALSDPATAVSAKAGVGTYILQKGGGLTVAAQSQNVTDTATEDGATVNIDGSRYSTYDGTVQFDITFDDLLALSNTVDISGATIQDQDASLWTTANGKVDLNDAWVTMTTTQHGNLIENDSESVNIIGNAPEITLSDAGTVTGDAAIETYKLAAAGGSNFTLGAAGQSVDTGDSAGDTVIVDGQTANGTFTTVAADTIELATGSDIQGIDAESAGAGTAFNANNLTLQDNASVTMTQAQHQSLIDGTVTADGSDDTITLTSYGPITGQAVIENYVLDGSGPNTFAAAAAEQTITAAGGADVFTYNDANQFGDTINGFATAIDHIILDAGGAGLFPNAVETGGDTSSIKQLTAASNDIATGDILGPATPALANILTTAENYASLSQAKGAVSALSNANFNSETFLVAATVGGTQIAFFTAKETDGNSGIDEVNTVGVLTFDLAANLPAPADIILY